MLKRVQHDRWFFRHSEFISESIYFFNLFNYFATFLWPQRNVAQRNSRRRFRSHENCIIQQSSLTTRDFVYFLMFQNHSNSSTLCFINILGLLRYCRFLVTWYLLYFIFRHSEFISESNTEEMLKRVQHDCIKQTSIKQTLCIKHRVCCFV